MNRVFRVCLPLAAALLAVSLPAFASEWTAPTPEELSMKDLPSVPGAPALYLFKEQTTDDVAHTLTFYVRLKVLTEAGKDYANVELPFYTGQFGYTVDNVVGRTVHPDGSIVMFTGKPYEKLVEKGGGYQFKSKVFTLPDVQVGSILEYRYRFHFDNTVNSPDWIIQNPLYIRQAHYMWRPTTHELVDAKGDSISNNVAWTPLLPPGAEVKVTQPGGQRQLDLTIKDVPPLPHAEMMPPTDSLGYRVLFYYTGYNTEQEFWLKEGKHWSDARNKFIGPGNEVRKQVAALVSPSDTPDVKLHKIYAQVMKYENTDFTRERTQSENQAEGSKQVLNTDDVLRHERASGDQLAELFVAMCRAAGLKAYLAAVSDRKHRLFLLTYLSMRQLDDYIAIVNVDGKDVFFDPGQRYCSYGHLAWNHAPSNGLRQTDQGVELLATNGVSYADQHVSRIADLALDDRGTADGVVTLKFTGDAALAWRQEALSGDNTSLNKGLKQELERMLPGGMDVRVTDVAGLADYDQPLTVTYAVKGNIGSSTGKRLLVPANLFESNSKTKFAEASRDVGVDLHHATFVQDAVRFKLPPTVLVESAPSPAQASLKGMAVFNTLSKTGDHSITMYRNATVARILFTPAEYPDLRTFYDKLEAKDQETLVLTHAPAIASSGGGH